MVKRLAGQEPSLEQGLRPAGHKGGSRAGPEPAAGASPLSRSPDKACGLRHRQTHSDEARLRPSQEVDPQVRKRPCDGNQGQILPTDQQAGPYRQDWPEVNLGSSPRIRVWINEVHGQAQAWL